MSDLISRQAAIEYLMTNMNWYDEDGYESDDDYKRECITELINGVPSAQPDERMLHESCTDCPLYDKDRHSCPRFNKVIPVTLRELQSAQQEPLTDKEQRIFLAAMGREEKVCKQVDEECRDCREAYEDSLVKTCHEIIRKVKGALWT